MRPNSRLMKATLTGALGGLLYGFDTVVISGMIDPVVRLYRLSPRAMGLTVAASPVGTIIGCFAAGVIGQRLGARAALRLAAGTLSAGGAGSRVLGKLAHAPGGPLCRRPGHRRRVGAGAGLYCRAGARRAARTAGWIVPDQRRFRDPGRLHLQLPRPPGPCRQLAWIRRLAGDGRRSRILPAFIFLALLFGIPRSPRWRPRATASDEALAVLARWAAPDRQGAVAEIQSALSSEHAVARAGLPLEVPLSRSSWPSPSAPLTS